MKISSLKVESTSLIIWYSSQFKLDCKSIISTALLSDLKLLQALHSFSSSSRTIARGSFKK